MDQITPLTISSYIPDLLRAVIPSFATLGIIAKVTGIALAGFVALGAFLNRQERRRDEALAQERFRIENDARLAREKQERQKRTMANVNKKIELIDDKASKKITSYDASWGNFAREFVNKGSRVAAMARINEEKINDLKKAMRELLASDDAQQDKDLQELIRITFMKHLPKEVAGVGAGPAEPEDAADEAGGPAEGVPRNPLEPLVLVIGRLAQKNEAYGLAAGTMIAALNRMLPTREFIQGIQFDQTNENSLKFKIVLKKPLFAEVLNYDKKHWISMFCEKEITGTITLNESNYSMDMHLDNCLSAGHYYRISTFLHDILCQGENISLKFPVLGEQTQSMVELFGNYFSQVNWHEYK